MLSISASKLASTMLGETPTVNQRSPRCRVAAFDQHAGDRLGAAGQDAHLVVDEFDVLMCDLVAAEILAQRLVERVDRAVAFGDRPQWLRRRRSRRCTWLPTR